MTRSTNLKEINNFNKLADQWWDETGPMAPLHKMNPVRLDYIKQQICDHFSLDYTNRAALKGLSILDIGCGAGLVSEPLARMGAKITAIDQAQDALTVAKDRSQKQALDIDYKFEMVEQRAKSKQKFDVVLALEVIEHVDQVPGFVQSCAQCLKPGGLIVYSTLNRTAKSYALAILGAEYVLQWLPRGTHSWRKFLKPSELARHCVNNNLRVTNTCGLIYKPVTQQFMLRPHDLSVNYFLTAQPDQS